MNLVNSLLHITALGTEWVLWLLIILSITSVALMIERFVFFRKIQVDFPKFSDELNRMMLAGNIEGAKKICEGSQSLESQVAKNGFDYIAKGPKAMEQIMTGYLIGARQTLDRGLTILGTLGNNAPFIGLFGTVLGIIKAFQDLAVNPTGGPSVVMAGIAEALIATAVGLLVAIPAVIAFNAYQRKVKRHMANAEAISKLILSHQSEH